MEVEFQHGATVKVRPVTWNKHTLQVKAPGERRGTPPAKKSAVNSH